MDNVACVCDRYIAGVSDSFGARPHSHPVLELYVSCEGASHVVVEGTEVEGDVVLIAPGVGHAISDTGRRGLAVFVDPLMPLGYGITRTYLDERPFATVDVDHASHDREILSGVPTEDAIRRFADLLIGAVGTWEGGRPFSRPVFDTIDYLQHPDAEFKMDVLASRACLSKSRLAHLFSAETGITLKEYLLYKRMEQACRVMTGGGSVTDAAAELGYSSPSHIATSSMRLTGMQLTRMLGL